jgi:precorrin-2 dehydrogenase/sirohydrochlorin ferrochelatase
MASLFPIFLKLERRRVLVVGAGAIAEQKLAGLLSAGASIHVVAPTANDAFRKLAADGRLRWSQREYLSSDLDGAVLVIAGTGNPEINERIFRDADSRNIPCNAVDEPDRCHFYYPAVVQRGDLQIAISTAGHSPALAQRIRKELEQRFDATYADWLHWLGDVRRILFTHAVDPQRRRTVLHRIARADVYENFRRTRARKVGTNHE